MRRPDVDTAARVAVRHLAALQRNGDIIQAAVSQRVCQPRRVSHRPRRPARQVEMYSQHWPSDALITLAQQGASPNQSYQHILRAFNQALFPVLDLTGMNIAGLEPCPVPDRRCALVASNRERGAAVTLLLAAE
jgi:hypothetical protein